VNSAVFDHNVEDVAVVFLKDGFEFQSSWVRLHVTICHQNIFQGHVGWILRPLVVHIVGVSADKNDSVVTRGNVQIGKSYITSALQIYTIVVRPLQRARNRHVVNNNVLHTPVKWAPVSRVAEPKVRYCHIDCINENNASGSAFSLTPINQRPYDRFNLVLLLIIAVNHLPHGSWDYRVESFTNNATICDILRVNHIPEIPIIRVILNVIRRLNECSSLQIEINIGLKMDCACVVSPWRK